MFSIAKSCLIPFIFLSLLLVSCSDDEDPTTVPEVADNITITAGGSAAADAQTAFIEASDGATINFGSGQFSFTNTLSIDGKNEIVIKGAGRNETILDFSGQVSGGDGVLATNCNSIRFENLTIRDSQGDALKTRDCNKISFVNVATVWSGEPGTDNGAYGLYPVLCSEVYIDNCYAYGASDAGIYVGQSDRVIVKNSVAEGNVAGIEIENTTNAEVFDNEAFDNTGGILVFDLPGLTKTGLNTRVYNNNVHDNNRINFAPEGNIVGNVPIGTGIMVLSTTGVEIFQNTLTNNNFAGVLISSLLIFEDDPGDLSYGPFPYKVSVSNNTYVMEQPVDTANQKELIQQLLGVMALYQLPQPNILMDGIILSPLHICIDESAGTSFVNLNVTDMTFASVSTDISTHSCSLDPLPQVTFDPF